MANKFVLEVVTPDRKFYNGETSMVIVRTLEGDIGILNDHEPLVAPVKIGRLKIQNDQGGFDVAACSSGFVTIDDESRVMIITDAAEWSKDIDVERAQASKERAEQRLNQGKSDQNDTKRAKASLTRAINRINVHSGE